MTSSLVSLSKRLIHEEIPGLNCGDFQLEPAIDNKPVILHVPDSYYYRPDIEGDNHQVHVDSGAIVESVVRMHNTAQLGFLPSPPAHPAFFCIIGRAVSALDLSKEFASKVKEAQDAQRRWFITLVKMADDDFRMYRRHQAISDLQRAAARELGLEREWLFGLEDEVGAISTKVDCPMCGSELLNPNAPICPNCGRVHNPVRLAEIEKSLGITQVEVKK